MPNIDRDDENATRYETKPTIDEQIEHQEASVAAAEDYGDHQALPKERAILATLEAHKRIAEAAGRPEPVAWRLQGKNGHVLSFSKPKIIGSAVLEPLYGPDLLAAYDRVAAERDAKDRLITNYEEWLSVQGEGAAEAIKRAETAERQLAECETECSIRNDEVTGLTGQLAELQRKHDGLVARLREPVDEYLNISDLWKKSEDDAEGMDLGHPTQAHYFAALLQQAMSAVALREGDE